MLVSLRPLNIFLFLFLFFFLLFLLLLSLIFFVLRLDLERLDKLFFFLRPPHKFEGRKLCEQVGHVVVVAQVDAVPGLPLRKLGGEDELG